MTPALPPELELHIFSLAAFAHPKSVPTLALVAKRVREWTEPILYRTLFFPHHPCLPVPELPRYRLAVWSLERSLRTFLCCFLEHDLPNLTHLYCSLENLLNVSAIDFATYPLFASITHLELLAMGYDGPAVAACSMPRLTHLALNVDRPLYNVCVEILRVGRNLEALVFLSTSSRIGFVGAEDDAAFSFIIQDGRFVWIREGDYWKDWQQGRLWSDSTDYWKRADQLIARRRAGRVPREVILLEDIDAQLDTRGLVH
ncbi:hypothetical protein HMN09_01418700 [Mycena chlorophos]|uniref:Uncharacterized protein n=1 Tax=Mycena chlorophos TaxID=658473 RepID=A0A8H6RWI3_MYCCL|nr:hypothetical protein HMN09_01418700 [Mycena chlorophos]